MTAPHERPEFTNQATYTVAITYTVTGGARRATADRRAEKVAERLANAACRLGDVVDVTATAGANVNGEIILPKTVRFATANSGHDTHSQPGKLARYLDPDHERALASLAKANADYQARKDADRDRRRQVACANPYGPSAFLEHRACDCVYCRPQEHWWAVEGEREAPGHWSNEHRCLCGQRVAAMGQRCKPHRDASLVVLDGDPERLQLLAREYDRQNHDRPRDDHDRDRTTPTAPDRTTRPQLDEPDHGLEL